VTTPPTPTTPASTALDTTDERLSEEVVVLRNGVKRFGATTALNGASMTVRQGESHGLVGRNGAGKSTIVSILTGLQPLTEGTLHLNGQPAPPLTDRKAWLGNVSCVYQHRTLVPEMSVAENLYLGTYEDRQLINWKSLNAKAQTELDRWEIPISSRQQVAELGVGEAQMIEIVRALTHGSRFVILDEPTAQLVSNEIETLISRVNQLRDRGVTFLFISHHLDEVPQVCDAVTVLRNGTDVLHGRARDLSTADMVTAMVGDDAAGADLMRKTHHRGRKIDHDAPCVLEVEELTAPGQIDEFAVTMKAGEVVGLAGHAGSGSRQIARSLAGHQSRWTGRMRLRGQEIRPERWDPYAAVRTGITLVPEDRIKEGLVGGLSIEDNITLTTLRQLTKNVLLDRRKRRRAAETARAELGVACSSVDQPVGQLSGGNQQKVLLGAALGPRPTVLILMHPTAGVDIASKATILQIVEDYRRDGLAVLLVSDEPEELEFCDRVQVWVRGRLALEGSGLSEDQLVAAMEGSAAPPVHAEAGHGSTTKADEVHP
jgi:simple sugar transport system ATP-binding protein